MKQGISLPQIPKNLQTDNKELYDYLFGLQQALLAKQTDDYGAVDKTSTDLTTLSGSVTSFIANNRASQAQAIAGTLDTKIITPKSLRQGFNASGSAPVFACRAWVNFNGTTNTGGYCTIKGSGNVTSVHDDGTGLYTINFETALPDANYAWAGSAIREIAGAAAMVVSRGLNDTKTASSLQVRVVYATSAYDVTDVNVIIFR